MPMMRVSGLGDGTPASAPGGTTAPTAFNFSALPTDLIAGAKKWLTPGEAIDVLKGPFTGGGIGNIGVLAGVALVPLLLLSVLKGRKRF